VTVVGWPLVGELRLVGVRGTRLVRGRSISRPRRVGPLLLVLVVSGLTVASARSPGLTSGLLAERPLGPSIISFAFLAYLTLLVCGWRAFWLAAIFGHVCSTVLVYGVIGVAWSLNPSDLHAVLSSADYGVSAISAAWLGAIAAVGWRARGQTPAGRLTIVLSCLAVAVFAYTLHPGLTLFASEHVVAFAVGVAVAAAWAQPDWSTFGRFARPVKGALTRVAAPRPLFLRVDPFVGTALVIVVVLVGGSVMSSALASLPRTLIGSSHLTAGRCVDAWNRSQAGSTLPSSRGRPALILVGSNERERSLTPPPAPEFCSYLIVGGARTALLFRARWNRGAIGAWGRMALRGRDELPTNAVLTSGGSMQLDGRRRPASA
jgi:hypothetical protein